MDSSQFFQETFSSLAGEGEYDALSQKLDATGVQESCAVRNTLTTRELAKKLIDEEGQLLLDLVPEVLQAFEANMYTLGPMRQHDSRRQEQILRVLHCLQKNKDLERRLKKIGKPHRHPLADQVIRDTLDLSAQEKITDAHARRASLAAWMCYLRQNVGSCFATAPAILIHNEQPEQLLADFAELLATGRLKRTFGGVEYSVPFSSSWGTGDLKKPLIVQQEEGKIEPKLFEAPGLLAALEGFSEQEIIAAILRLSPDAPQYIVTCEEIIKEVLLSHFGLTRKDLEEEEKRPRDLRPSAVMVHPPTTAGKGIKQFKARFEEAKRAFKILAENALLKTWEFTIASFAETKADFTRWNLYSSLGFRPEDEGGIGTKVYEMLKGRLDQLNHKVEELQAEYEQAFVQVQYLQSRLKRAASEQEANWLKIDYQSRLNELNSVEEMRNTAHNQGKRIAHLYEFMLDHYYKLFPNYFQEVYDAEMRDVQAGPFDDSPAGFRLLYKHGRDNTSLWTKVRNQYDYIEALIAFFTATETEFITMPELEGMEPIISEVVTAIVSHIQTPEFLETAFYRMARAHQTPLVKDPLDNLDKIQKKPWVYTSGGVMSSLVSCYFKSEEKPTDADVWVENTMELLVFILDTLKQIPPKVMKEFLEGDKRSLIMHSPTHAFLLKPKFEPVFSAFQHQEFTYTWVRDQLIAPMQQFAYRLKLESGMVDFLIEELKRRTPKHFRHYFSRSFTNLYGEMHPRAFRDQVLEQVNRDKQARAFGFQVLSEEQIDTALYSMLPLFPSEKLQMRLEEIFSALKVKGVSEIVKSVSQSVGRFQILTAEDLLALAQGIFCKVQEKVRFPRDEYGRIVKTVRALGYALPKPVLFADSNWEKDLFAFVVNPCTEKLEFWRVDESGFFGSPMHDWKHWLDGSRKKPTWGIYTNPYEYTALISNSH